jgi:F-type H+-transporting ATPase subunit c
MDDFYVKAVAFLGVALGMGLGAIGPSIGMGMVGTKACESIAKAPEHSGKIRMTMMLAMGFIEACAIYSFILCIWILLKI